MPPAPQDPHQRVLGLSARTPEDLTAACVRLGAYLAENAELSIDDVATTLAVGRDTFACRYAVIGRERAAVAETLRAGPYSPVTPGLVAVTGLVETGHRPRVAFVFGDGAGQPTGTAAHVALPELGRWAQHARELLGDAPLRPLVWVEPGADDPSRADALLGGFVTEFGVARQLAAWGLVPDRATGRGIGAFAAAATSGALTFDEALAQVAGWGRLVEEGLIESEADSDEPMGDLAGDVDVTVEIPPGAAIDDVLGMVAVAWCRGAAVDLRTGMPGRRIHLPVYPFRRGEVDRPRANVTAGSPNEQARPLTPAEQRILFLDLVRGSANIEHIVAVTATAAGLVDIDTLNRAFADLQRAHPRLRTVFTERDRGWVAVVSLEPVVSLVVRREVGPTGLDALQVLVRNELVNEPFAPMDAPLIRGLVLAGDDGYVIGLAAYRGLIDGGRLGSLLEKLIQQNRATTRQG
jgi:acyl transferase domain-containing protein